MSTISDRPGEELSDTMYPEPPRNSVLAPMYYGFLEATRFLHCSHEPFATSVAFDAAAAMYAQEYYTGYRYDNGESRVPSSSLSAATDPAPSSAMGSPLSNHGQLALIREWSVPQGLGVSPGIVEKDCFFSGAEYAYVPDMDSFIPLLHSEPSGIVDPSLIYPEPTYPVAGRANDHQHEFSSTLNPHRLSVASYDTAYPASPALSSSPQLRRDSVSPFVSSNAACSPFAPFSTTSGPQERRPSQVSFTTFPQEDEAKLKQRCPHRDCGKTFKDLKAHMLTHQTERPEKCPIVTCEYHIKGFSRKYDKNRHTLTHFKGTMVCGFCPGSGSAAEKSFNRADVFKRHLTAVHGVEQSPPNSRKKVAITPAIEQSPPNSRKKVGITYAIRPKMKCSASDATSKCTTCSQTFSDAQDFYEHLDDCVLRIVQQKDPLIIPAAVDIERSDAPQNPTTGVKKPTLGVDTRSPFKDSGVWQRANICTSSLASRPDRTLAPIPSTSMKWQMVSVLFQEALLSWTCCTRTLVSTMYQLWQSNLLDPYQDKQRRSSTVEDGLRTTTVVCCLF